MGINLAAFDDKLVRIALKDGTVYEGECAFNSAEYCDVEYGRNESSLAIDDFLFYKGQISSVEIIEAKETYVWDNMTEHLMRLDHDAFIMMEKGRKTIELRLYDEKRRKIKIGDIIRFEDLLLSEDSLRMVVDDLYVFDTFAQLYEQLPLRECGYAEDSIANADPADMNKYYPPEKQAEYQVVGIRMHEY